MAPRGTPDKKCPTCLTPLPDDDIYIIDDDTQERYCDYDCLRGGSVVTVTKGKDRSERWIEG